MDGRVGKTDGWMGDLQGGSLGLGLDIDTKTCRIELQLI